MAVKNRLSCGIFYCSIILTAAMILLMCGRKTEVTEHGIFAPSRLNSVIGQDGVCSINFSSDITLWTFADTIVGKWKSCKGRELADKNEAVMEGMLSNSIAWSEKITAENFSSIKLEFYRENGKVSQFIKNMSAEDPRKHRFWALDGFRSGNRLYVYYLHVLIPDHRKPLGFEVLYTGLARWDVPEGWKPGDKMDFRRLGPVFGKEYPYFGAAVMTGNGYVYLAGHCKKSSGSFPLSFARVRSDRVEDSGSYSFLSKEGLWTDDIKTAGGFFGDVSGECSFSFNGFLKEYVIIYSKIFTGDICQVRFKDFEALPSATSEILFRVRKENDTGMWPYSAKEIFSEGRSLYLIYIDPGRYQPLLLEIKY